jgi:hypothetical protein
MNLRKQIEKLFNDRKPFKIKVDVQTQESKHIAINMYMSLEQSDELIKCLEASGEVSNSVLEALSEAIRNRWLQRQKDMQVWSDQFKHWD